MSLSSSKATDGSTVFFRSENHIWRFDVVQNVRGGWKVCGLQAPDLCGTYVEC